MRRVFALVVAGLFLFAACSNSTTASESFPPSSTQTESESPAGGCGATPAGLAETPELPLDFPTPGGVVYTEEKAAGPSTIVKGFFAGDLDAIYQSYQHAFASAGYTVTDKEQEEDDAEVNFEGGETNGQVKLQVPCDGQVNITITIRPD
jgi:hypothetical protein